MEDREISRKEAIKRLEEGEPFNELYDPQWEAALALAIKALKAEPVRYGHWEMLHKTHGADEDSDYDWRCSECSHVDCHNINVEVPYCWYCGAKMNEIEEEIEEEKMPRLIDANEILKSEHQHYAPMADEYYVTVRDIENAPTVDAVPVVRCEDCESSITPRWDSDEVYCTKHGNWFKINGYCHLGRKK